MEEVTLETERLLLRWLREEDFEQYARMCRDQEVMRFIGGQLMTDIEVWRQMTSFVGHWYFRGYGIWAVEEKSSGQLVGRIGFLNPSVGLLLSWAGRWPAKVGAKAMRPKAHSAHFDMRLPSWNAITS